MSDEAALLAAIVAHPADDTPRLIYADWLDEHRPDAVPSPAAGPSARAEFVRVQCRLARRPYDDPDYPELLERERDLVSWMQVHDKEFLNTVPGLPDDLEWYGWYESDGWGTVVRGFPDEVEFMNYGDTVEETVDLLAAVLEEAFAKTTVHTLRLEDAMGGEIDGLMEHPAVAGLRGLYLDYLSDDDEVKAVRGIAGSEHLTGLRRLYLDFPLDERSLRALSGAANLGSLEALSLGASTPGGLGLLARARWFRKLRALQVWADGPEAFRSVAELPPMPDLVSLTVRGPVTPTPAAVRKFASSASLPRLAHLEFDGTRLSPELVAALARGRWPLRHLRLNDVRLRRDGAAALAGAAFAGTLRVLELPDCAITAGGVQALAASERLAGLRHLDLSGNPVGAAGLAALARGPHLRGLRALDLGNTHSAKVPLDARAVQGFLAALDMPELRHLILDRLPVGVRGARTIASGGSFAGLTRLELRDCGLGEGGARAVAESGSLGNLAELDLGSNRAGKGVSRLADPKVLPRLGECNLYHNRVPKWALARLRKRPGVIT